MNYQKSELENRREESQENLNDVFVWSNTRVMKWLNSIGLSEFSINLKESGIHGSIIALDSNFKADDLALTLKLPNNHPVCYFIAEVKPVSNYYLLKDHFKKCIYFFNQYFHHNYSIFL